MLFHDCHVGGGGRRGVGAGDNLVQLCYVTNKQVIPSIGRKIEHFKI
jgi:hypothetical protein